MPDKWEYPWFAAWDLAFHMIPFATHRSRLRQGAAPPAAARVVHAPQRPDPGLRVRLRRREPAGARLGLLARLQDDGAQAASAIASSSSACSRSCCSTSPGGSTARTRTGGTSSPAASSGSTTSACSTARSRCRPAGTSSRPTAPRGWPSTATPCSPMALELASEDPAYEDVASKFFEHFVAIADAMNTPWRHGPLGRGGRLLLRPAPRGRRATCRSGSARWSASCRSSRSRSWRRRSSTELPGVPEADELVPGEPAGPRAADRVHAAAAGRHGRAAAARDSLARAARAGAALPARRDRVPLAVRHPLGLARAPGAALRVRRRGHRAPGRLRPRRVEHRPLRRQLQLARARSGFRSTTSCSRRWSATTTSTATTSGSNARRARAGC